MVAKVGFEVQYDDSAPSRGFGQEDAHRPAEPVTAVKIVLITVAASLLCMFVQLDFAREVVWTLGAALLAAKWD